MSRNTQGIGDRIRRATSAAEVDALVEEGAGYKYASDRTRNRWRRKAKKRKEELDNDA